MTCREVRLPVVLLGDGLEYKQDIEAIRGSPVTSQTVTVKPATCPYLADDDARHEEHIVDDGDHPAPLDVRSDVIQQLLVPL